MAWGGVGVALSTVGRRDSRGERWAATTRVKYAVVMIWRDANANRCSIIVAFCRPSHHRKASGRHCLRPGFSNWTLVSRVAAEFKGHGGD